MAQVIQYLQDFTYETIIKKYNANELIKDHEEVETIQKKLLSSTLHVMAKDSLLDEIKNSLSLLSKSLSDKNQQKEMKKLIAKIEFNKRETEWNEFEKHFDLLHSRFFKILKKNYPQLTIAEVKLCGLIKMKMATKEMAQYLNISLRGVETQRYRLRKKLNIKSGACLEEIIDQMDISNKESQALKLKKIFKFA